MCVCVRARERIYYIFQVLFFFVPGALWEFFSSRRPDSSLEGVPKHHRVGCRSPSSSLTPPLCLRTLPALAMAPMKAMKAMKATGLLFRSAIVSVQEAGFVYSLQRPESRKRLLPAV